MGTSALTGKMTMTSTLLRDREDRLKRGQKVASTVKRNTDLSHDV